MNNLNNSKYLYGQGSPGFIYFDNSLNNASNSGGNLDFIEFSSTSSPQTNFQPQNFSSPTNNFRQRNYYKNRNRRQYNNQFSNKNYHTSRDSFNSFNSSNNSYKQSGYDVNDISQYYHPSMTEDPWAELEKEIESNSQSDSDQSSGAPFKRFDLDDTSNCDDSLDSQEDSQVSAESS